MKHILLPTDFSENSWNAVVYALNLYKNVPCNFFLLHVVKPNHLVVTEPVYFQTFESTENLSATSAKNKLKQLLERISKSEHNYKTHKFFTLTDYNFFIESIRAQVEEKKIDTIVMGTKGASGLQQYIVGSNTGDVITKVQCTTLVVPENAQFKTLKKIAFPTDFSMFYHNAILSNITDILDHHHSKLELLHITKKGADLNIEQQQNKDYLEDYFSNYKHDFHFLINKNIEDAIQHFIETRKVDLITMVAKNLNYFQKLLFHPTVEKLGYHTDIPFLVVHE